MTPSIKNLFATKLPEPGAETIITLIESELLRLEQILSNRATSPKDFWYDQENDEWVFLIRGTATLTFENGEIVSLTAGDYLLIERHKKHRLEKTSPDAIWLALHLEPENEISRD